jgi:glycosyltransferase involved in cell wall biosynthesis
VSRHIRSELARRGIDRPALVIPCGVAIPAAPTRFRADPFQVVFSGRIWEHQKRASLVIQALISACRTGGNIQATMIGEGYARQACEQQVAEAGLNEAIRFTGALTPAAVQERLLDAQAILLMSDFEGLPIALMEAMAAGVVPVVRAIPSGIPELVHHERTGLLVSEDPEEAARSLRRLADDPELWKRCSAASRNLVTAHYSNDASYLLWRRLLDELDQRFHAAAASPFPLDGRRIEGLWRLDRRFHREYRTTTRRLPPVRQVLRTAIARTKHRLRTALGRRP